MRSQHPGIFQIGRVMLTPGGSTLITGWGLKACAGDCPCHRHPVNRQLYLAEDQDAGTLGLRSFVDNTCGCCTPWTAAELAAVVRDLDAAERSAVPEPGR